MAEKTGSGGAGFFGLKEGCNLFAIKMTQITDQPEFSKVKTMHMRFFKAAIPAVILSAAMAGCGTGEKPEVAQNPAAENKGLAPAEKLELSQVVSSQLAPLSLNGNNYLLLASEKRGLVLLNEDGSEIASLDDGKVERFALQVRDGNYGLVAAFDENGNKIRLVRVTLKDGQPLFEHLAQEQATAPLETLCLSRQGEHTHLFAIDEEGLGREYVLHSQGENWAFRNVRPLYFGQQVSSCAVDDTRGRLLVAQPPLGIWSLNASAEQDEERTLFASAPGEEFGGLWVDAVTDRLWLTSEEKVLAYKLNGDGAAPDYTAELEEQEVVSAAVSAGALVALEEESDTVLRFTTDLPEGASAAEKIEIPNVTAHAQTQQVASAGDAADDPAIWVNPVDASASLILGTDKKSGLEVYDLSGKRLQYFPVGRVNNVDLRSVEHPQFAAIAAASNRSTQGINLFGITAAGKVESLGLRPLDFNEPYGLCMAQIDGRNFAWVSDKDGGVHQSEIVLGDNPSDWQLLSRGSVKVGSQVEGCVSDDERNQLFFGEEDRGIWRLDLAAFNAGEGKPQLVAEVDGERLVDDVEGIGLYLDGDNSYLVVSSQGNNSYALYSRDGTGFVGHFRVDMNPANGIDGASETDGLEVSSANLGGDYTQGLLVVQDGRKRMPGGNQNFKLVAWADIADRLELQ